MTYGYCRVSTSKQETSIDAQAAKIRQYCELHELGEVEIVCETESAKTMKRPALRGLLKHMKRGDTLVIYKLDRLSRSVRDILDILDHFQKKNINLASVTEFIDTRSAVGRFIVGQYALLAEFERGQTSERTSMALQHKARNGERVGRHATFGYKIVGGVQVEDPHEQHAIRLMKEMRVNGLTLTYISHLLCDRGFYARGTTGTPISTKTIANVLRRMM